MRSRFRSEDIHRDGRPDPCPTCEKFSNCKKLCPKVEAWVNQDHVGRKYKEILLNHFPDMDHYTNEFVDHMNFHIGSDSLLDKNLADSAWETIRAMNLPKKTFDFARLYYRQGKTLAEVAGILKISSQAANNRHQKLKKDVKDRLQRFEIWNAIKDNYMNREVDKYEMADMLYFGAFYSLGDITKRLGIHYTTAMRRVNKIKDKFFLDKNDNNKD